MRRACLPTLAVLALLAWTIPASADLRVFEGKPAAPDEPRPSWFPDLHDFTLDLYGWVQPRFTVQQQDDRPQVNLHPNPAFTVQRVRLGTVASLGKWAKAQVEIDFAREIANPVDAFVVLSPIHEPVASLNLTLGQFRVPFSRQNLLPSKTLQLPDLAYFVSSKFIVDRDIGGMLWSELFEGKLKVSIGMFNGNEPGRGQTQNSDPYFLYTARIEASPLGPVPRFEGDLRPVHERHKPVFSIGAGVMRNHFDDKHFNRNYVGADVAAFWEGASLYGEFYYHVDDPLFTTGPNATTQVKQMGWNVQAGYFPPISFLREHVEIVGRVESIDPNIDVKVPANDAGARDLDQSNPTWGYLGVLAGLNFFWTRTHDLKLQASYEVRNETKRCLEGQSGAGCTGYINNNLFVVQATAGF